PRFCLSPVSHRHSSSAHRYLHSFPTRRSSDLGSRDDARGDRRDSLRRELRNRGGERNAYADAIGTRHVSLPGRARRPNHGSPSLDRKSTRLNSSHGSISYAVFCLKKKKTSNIQ